MDGTSEATPRDDVLLRMVLISPRSQLSGGGAMGGIGELWLTHDAIVRVQKSWFPWHIGAVVLFGAPAAGFAGAISGIWAAAAAGVLAALTATIVVSAVTGRGDPGSMHEISEAQWSAYLAQYGEDVEVVAFDTIASSKVRSGMSGGRLEITTNDGKRFRVHWPQDKGGVAAIRETIQTAGT